eukprot:sb/3471043/
MAAAVTDKISVPEDFGSVLRGYKGFNDVTLTTSNGEVVKANSLILGLNSPVISEMAEKDFLVELDMSDFTFEGVNCFVECCYTGSVEGQLNRDNFRDLNKISMVFKVDWIVKECFQFFCDICDDLDHDSLDDVHYLFTEAAFLVKERRDKKLVKALNCGLKEWDPELRTDLIQEIMARDPLEFVDAERPAEI